MLNYYSGVKYFVKLKSKNGILNHNLKFLFKNSDSKQSMQQFLTYCKVFVFSFSLIVNSCEFELSLLVFDSKCEWSDRQYFELSTFHLS